MVLVRTAVIGGSVLLVAVAATLVVATPEDAAQPTEKRKRQIFREQVLPHAGGKIPDDAFRADRLALNRLNKDGIAIPDGVLLDARRHDKQPNLMRNTDLEMSVIKIVLTPDGRYVPREGRFNDQGPRTVDSTYIIRPPIGLYKHEFRRFPQHQIHAPIPTTLQIPSNNRHNLHPLPHHQDKFPFSFGGFNDNQNVGNLLFNANQQFFSDYLHPFYTPESYSHFNSWFNELQLDQGRLVRDSGSGTDDRKRVRFPGNAGAPGVPPRFKPRKLGAATATPGPNLPPFTKVPQTNFACTHQERNRDQVFADKQTKCQVFHICQKDGRKDSFLCPKGTLYNQVLSQCDWWYNVRCS